MGAASAGTCQHSVSGSRPAGRRQRPAYTGEVEDGKRVQRVKVDSKGNIYTGEVEDGERVQKFVTVMAGSR